MFWEFNAIMISNVHAYTHLVSVTIGSFSLTLQNNKCKLLNVKKEITKQVR